LQCEHRQKVDSQAAAGLEEQELSEEVGKMTREEAEEVEDPSQAAEAAAIVTWLRLHS
jgi:hypothetical protein